MHYKTSENHVAQKENICLYHSHFFCSGGMISVYDDIPKELLELVEDVIFNRRPDATERLVTFADTVKSKGKKPKSVAKRYQRCKAGQHYANL